MESDKPDNGNINGNNSDTEIPHVLNRQVNWNNLFFYQKSDVIYQMAFAFCDRFIHLYKDRTRDQIIQAARSCKQNIVEGLADGVTSTEMQLKLLNVARASLKELREDFEDYIKARHRRFYVTGDAEYDMMLGYCRTHNQLTDYEPFFQQWTDEHMCNYGITICHMIDKMMMSFMEKLEFEFVTQGGIRERMHRARTGYRKQQDERLAQLEAETPRLHNTITELEAKLSDLQSQLTAAQSQLATAQSQLAAAQSQLATAQSQLATATTAATQWKAKYEDLKTRALNAYNRQEKEIAELKAKLES